MPCVEPPVLACAAAKSGTGARREILIAPCPHPRRPARPCGTGGISALRPAAFRGRAFTIGHVHAFGASRIFAESAGAPNPAPVVDRELPRSASPITSVNTPPDSRHQVLRASMKGSQTISFIFSVSPTEHASCRATSGRWLKLGITHPYPNLPIRGRRGPPRIPQHMHASVDFPVFGAHSPTQRGDQVEVGRLRLSRLPRLSRLSSSLTLHKLCGAGTRRLVF